ncbi:MAG: hypothetical protein WAU91_16555, partial [Desulfatitalea sp.]
EPHVVVQEPLLDDHYALQRIQTLTTRLRDQLAVLAQSAPAPAKTQPAPDNLPGLIQAIPAAVRKHAATYAERQRVGAELSILIHDAPLRELLLDFARRYGQGGDGPLDVLAGLLCGPGPKAPSQTLAQTRHLLTQIAEELKPLRVRDPLPKKELDPLAPIKRPAAEAQKNWVDLAYRYADGSGVAGAKYEVFDPGGGRLTAGTLGGDGTARAGIPLAVSHVQVRYSDDPKQKAILIASHPTPVSAPPGWSDRMSAALTRTWRTTTDAAGWTWGMIQGDFNEDPTVGQIITNAVITAIPLVDQVGDARDIAANVKMLAWDKRFKESTVWLGLFFTLIGLVPGLGSLLKGVLKLVFKSAPIEKILAVFNHFMQGNGVQWLKELKAGKLKEYAQQAAAQGHAIFAAAIDNLSRLKQHMPARLIALRAKTEDLLAGLRQTKAMIDDQFGRITRELTEKLDAILAKRADDLPGGAAKGKVQKQQRAEAPEGGPTALGRVPAKDLAEAEARLNQARTRLTPTSGYVANYSDDELKAMAKAGKVNDRFVVIIMESTHANNAAGYLGPKMPDGKVRYWATTYDQIENADTDPRRLTELTGRDYDPGTEYKMIIVDTEGAADAGAHTIVPTYDKLGDFAGSELKDLDTGLVSEVMTPEYSEKYAAAMKEFKTDGLDIKNTGHIEEFKNSYFDAPNEQNLFETRASLQRRLGANDYYTGNGLTKYTGTESGNTFGTVETFTYEKSPETIGKMLADGKIKILDAKPLE